MNRKELEQNVDDKLIDFRHKGVRQDDTLKSIMLLVDQYHNPPKSKKTLEDRKESFKGKLTPFLEKYGKNLLNEFYGYWTEHGDDDRKMRFEKQTSFSISRRLATWKKRNNDDSGDKKFEAKTEEYNK